MRSDINKKIGERIRMYRKARGMTLEQLASKVYKGKSVVSKYELGESCCDMETIFRIIEVLDISPSQIFYGLAENAPEKTDSADRSALFVNNTLYVYMLRKLGKRDVLIRGLLHLSEWTDVNAMFYLDVPDFGNYTRCKTVYSGALTCHPGNVLIDLTSVVDPSDHMILFSALKMNKPNYCTGMLMLSDYNNNEPGAFKVLLSAHPLVEDQVLNEILTINKEDLSGTRKSNIFNFRDFELPEDI